MTDARTLVTALRRLSDVDAPPLTPGVMAATGLGDTYCTLDSPVGPVYVAFNTHGISAVSRAESPGAFEAHFRSQWGRPIYPALRPPALLDSVRSQLWGEPAPDLRFDLRGITEFERAVLRKTLQIPRGEVRPYAWIAREIGHPKAVRAVGSALAGNPIPLLIPCHRVVRSDGVIGNYGLGGPAVKRDLLEREGARPDEIEGLARRGIRLVGSDTTHVFCFPTCRHARRITPPHRHAFATAAEAEGAGYRACRHCRPA